MGIIYYGEANGKTMIPWSACMLANEKVLNFIDPILSYPRIMFGSGVCVEYDGGTVDTLSEEVTNRKAGMHRPVANQSLTLCGDVST